jgi:hypothetical protein
LGKKENRSVLAPQPAKQERFSYHSFLPMDPDIRKNVPRKPAPGSWKGRFPWGKPGYQGFSFRMIDDAVGEIM